MFLNEIYQVVFLQYLYFNAYIYVYMCICVYVCVYIYVYHDLCAIDVSRSVFIEELMRVAPCLAQEDEVWGVCH